MTLFADTLRFTPRHEAPRLSDGTVTLRGHTLPDFDLFWQFYQTSTRTGFMGAAKNPTHLWYGMGSEIASWPLRGMGAWAVEADDTTVGQIAITQPPHFPEVEIGWTLFDGFEGKGLAYRAASLALDWLWTSTPLPTVVSYITPGHSRSIALAERLGARPDETAPLPDGEGPDETRVYRHRRPT